MSVAKVTELSAASNESFEDAIDEGLSRANKTLENVKSAWVKEQSVTVEDGTIHEYRVDLKITFVLKD